MLINGVKFSCATCIKGHRASHCKHTDRPLFEIRKKGRPVTQCPLCRDLRKTKQLHIKCECNKKNKKETIIINKIEKNCTCQHQESSSPSSTSTPTSSLIPTSKSTSVSPSYRWAIISPSENDYCKLHFHQDVGYVFRKKSIDKNRSHFNSSSPPSSSPFLTTNNIQSSFSTPLFASINNNDNSSNEVNQFEKDMLKELDDDLCNLLDSMIEKESTSTSSISTSTSSSTFHVTSTSSSLSPTPSPSSTLISPNHPNHHSSSSTFFYGQCQKALQWYPNSPPPGQVGESVIITMTPLPKWDPLETNNHQNNNSYNNNTMKHSISTTRLVTCYCGDQCQCNGCLVHPTSLFASQGVDPYSGYPSIPSQHSSSDEDQ